MTNTKELLKYEVQHWRSGNGWAVAQLLPDEYCRIIEIGGRDKSGKWKLGTQLFLACTRPTILKRATRAVRNTDIPPTMPPEYVQIPVDELDPEIVEALTPIREGLASGKLKVVNTRLVEADPF